MVGVGTVLTADQADDAIDAGAQFLVTPSVSEGVASVAAARDVPVIMGALSPTEVRAALDLGAAAVKIFPARAVGPDYLRDLHGPFPAIPLIPSGGVNAGNAAAYLRAGAVAVTAGTDVVAPDLRLRRSMGHDHRASRDVRRGARRSESELARWTTTCCTGWAAPRWDPNTNPSPRRPGVSRSTTSWPAGRRCRSSPRRW